MKMLSLSLALLAITASACGPQRDQAPKAAPPATRAETEPVEPNEIAVEAAQETLLTALSDPDPLARASRLATALSLLGPDSVAAARAVLEDLTLDLGGAETELLVTYWAKYEPQDAAAWVLKRGHPNYRLGALFVALQEWARQDPTAAAAASSEWMAKDPSISTVVPVAMVRGWYARGDADQEPLRQYIYGIGAGFPRLRAVAAYVRALIKSQGVDGVKDWAQSVSDEDWAYKLGVFRQVASVLPLFDFDAAMSWCDAHCDGPYGSNMRSLIARRWVHTDGAAAFDWLKSSPEGEERDYAVRSAFALWSWLERDRAMRWVADRTVSELPRWLWPAFPVYGRLLAEESPNEAIEFVGRVDDADIRNKLYINVAREWHMNDPEGADAWLRESPLSEEEREQARRPRGVPPTTPANTSVVPPELFGDDTDATDAPSEPADAS